MDSLKIGNITLPHRAVFGPMAGFTDAPCRRLMAQHGAGFTVSEMVSSRALVYHDHKTVSLLKAEPNGAPYGVQIFGEVPQIMGEAAAAIEEYQFDFLDINMGCPAPKIVAGGAGSKLMLDPDLCGRIVEQVKAHTTRRSASDGRRDRSRRYPPQLEEAGRGGAYPRRLRRLGAPDPGGPGAGSALRGSSGHRAGQ